MINKIQKSFFSLFFVLLSSYMFAQINVITPEPGNWANKQMLIIEEPREGEYYYSLNGTDPETFGFAYDGPVLIDLTGDVVVNITNVKPDGKKEKMQVVYNVTLDDGLGTNYYNLITKFYDSGVYNYTSGSTIDIPSNLNYKLDSGKSNPFIKGRTISLSNKNILSRYIPCTLSDEAKKIKYNFVIRTLPQYAGVFSRRDVPFTISEWDTLTFTSDKYIYKIDSEYWHAGTESRKIDRSVSHMISWQSIAFETGNPVEFFVLPPKPQISYVQEEDGCIVYSIDGDESYSMSILSSDRDYLELFTQVGIDSFYGNKEKGILELGVFSDSVYQGSVIAKYDIDKCPPSPPEIYSDCLSEVSRKKVNIDITADKKSTLYVKVIGPVNVPNAFNKISDFVIDEKLYKNSVYINKQHLEFEPAKEGSSYYKVIAWSVQGENKSLESSYNIIIDQYNYFYNENAVNSQNTGSYENPYTNFEDCLNGVTSGRSFCIWVTGDVHIPGKNFNILSNCLIKPEGETSFIFDSDSTITVKASTLEVSNIKFVLNDSASQNKKGMKPIIKLENSVLDMKNCVAGINFFGNGTFIESDSSVVNIRDSRISINARLYSSFITALKKSRISVSECQIGSSGDTTVIFSVTDSDININKNYLKITCSLGRFAELFNVRGNFTNNKITNDIQKKTANFSVIYKDKKTDILEFENESSLF